MLRSNCSRCCRLSTYLVSPIGNLFLCVEWNLRQPRWAPHGDGAKYAGQRDGAPATYGDLCPQMEQSKCRGSVQA